jgi:CRP-like cAMP-binding protein
VFSPDEPRAPIPRTFSEFDIEIESLAEYSVLDVAHRANDFEVEIDLSEVQVEARPATRTDEEPSADVLASLPAFPLFAEAPKAALLDLVQGADLVELEDGAKVVSEGAPADELYAIIEGRVRVALSALPPALQPTLSEGDLFGESCLLENEPRKADVVVEGRLFALRIPRLVLKKVIAAHPKVGETLFQLLTRRLVENLMQSSPLFTAFDPATRKELAMLFEVRRLAAGAKLFDEGKRTAALYIPLTGRVEIRSKARGEGDLAGPGRVLGHESLFFNVACDATATCAKEMALLCLPAASFGKVASQYPPVLAHLAEVSSEPSADFEFDGSSLLG